jgi:hypothetical protein
MEHLPGKRPEVDELIRELGVRAAGQRLGVAALLYTYQCTIACRHCCFGCAGDRPRVHMSTPQAVRHLHALHDLGRVIHIAGGECMMYWDDLKQVVRASWAEGAQPHFIETNCSFASDDAIVRERLGFLRDQGVAGILMSADPFHQAFIEPEAFLRVRGLARQIFGPRNVWCSDASDETIRDFAAIARDETRLREYVRGVWIGMVGTAHRELRGFLDAHPLEAVPPGHGWRLPHEGPDCAPEFDAERIWEIHIDPYDNIQTNCGVILGNAREVAPLEVIERGPANANPIARMLTEGGPLALARFAEQRHGFALPERVVSKCDLCYTVRSFLRPYYPAVLGPAEVYAA